MEDGVRVQLKADVDEDLTPQPKLKGWGFSITEGDASAFVDIGNKRLVERALAARDESLTRLVVDAVHDSSNTVAHELLDTAMDLEDGIFINGEHVSHEDLLESSPEQ